MDDYVDCGNPSSLNITNILTIEVWFKMLATPSGGVGIICKDDGSIRQYSFIEQASRIAQFRIWQSDGTVKSITTVPLEVGQGYHFVGTADGTYVRAYLDRNSFDTPVAYDGTIMNTDKIVTIGAMSSIANFFNGLISLALIYSRALTPQEISDHYIIGKEMFG